MGGSWPPKYHPTPMSGGDRKALAKELTKSRAMTGILAVRAIEKRAAGERAWGFQSFAKT